LKTIEAKSKPILFFLAFAIVLAIVLPGIGHFIGTFVGRIHTGHKTTWGKV